jgi:glycosyltransferase involved in cell wall biosynthesis
MSGGILFCSTMMGPAWGGSEELWSQAALLLHGRGVGVKAMVRVHGDPRPKLGWMGEGSLLSYGVGARTLVRRVMDRIRPERSAVAVLAREVGDGVGLVCFSNGGIGEELEAVEWCLAKGVPYVLVCQANAESWWPEDGRAERMAVVYGGARRVYFVSRENKRLLEHQLGVKLGNGEWVANPYVVDAGREFGWPVGGDGLRCAVVGRLDPGAKGQDLLFEVLGREKWRGRRLEVSLYGKGPMERSLRRLAELHGLGGRVVFRGQTADVTGIWDDHEVLILPSRHEGTPLVLIEAMLCGRVPVVTRIAGNGELVTDGVNGYVAAYPEVEALDGALERCWEGRAGLREMGARAYEDIRRMIPRDPAGDFAERLLAVAGG